MPFNWSPRSKDSFLFRYGTATVLVGAATLATSGLWLIVERPISAPLYVVAIVISAWKGGLRVGFYAALLAGFAIDFFFFPPFYRFEGARDELVRLLLFFGEGCVLSWLMEKFRRATEALIASREELRALTRFQETLRESERKSIALEIHDELGQRLTELKMDARMMQRRIAAGGAAGSVVLDGLDRLSEKIDGTIETVRRISSELRPSVLDDFGLVAASEWQVQQFEKNTHIRCEFASDFEDLDLGAESNSAVFRVLQEALTNVARHARASRVAVELRRGIDALIVRVVDDGAGIVLPEEAAKRPRTLGILGMRERSRLVGGELAIGTPESGGTVVELRVPMDRDAAVTFS